MDDIYQISKIVQRLISEKTGISIEEIKKMNFEQIQKLIYEKTGKIINIPQRNTRANNDIPPIRRIENEER